MTTLKTLMLALVLAAGAAWGDEASIRREVQTRFGVQVDEVAKMPYGGLYEVRMGDQIVYTDERVTYLMVGSLVDAKTRENITEARKEKRLAIKFADLPLDAAIKTVRGNGKNQLAVFADPNCSFCRRFERDLAAMTDVTIYTFLYPILDAGNGGDSMRKSRAIWCAKDRSKAWFDLMLRNVNPGSGGNCDTAMLQKNMELGIKLGITGTPTSFAGSGQRIVGARSPEVRKAVESQAVAN